MEDKMDFDKVATISQALANNLIGLEKAVELKGQTSRFRNVLNTQLIDATMLSCIAAIKILQEELQAELDKGE